MKKLRKAAVETGMAAAERGNSAVETAKIHIKPLIDQANETVRPIAHQAKVKSADLASRTLDRIQPGLESALDKVTPAVEGMQRKVQGDLLPKLQEKLHESAEHVAKKAPKKKRSKLKTAVKITLLGGFLAGAAAAIKQFLTSKDDGWTAHEPSRAYIHDIDFEEEVQSDENDEDGERDYGEGSYIGTTPPEGFAIKGNERSMKYHVEGTGGYNRTISDVWFDSEETARAAGFTKAQR